jgi:hypothetical protein
VFIEEGVIFDTSDFFFWGAEKYSSRQNYYV